MAKRAILILCLCLAGCPSAATRTTQQVAKEMPNSGLGLSLKEQSASALDEARQLRELLEKLPAEKFAAERSGLVQRSASIEKRQGTLHVYALEVHDRLEDAKSTKQRLETAAFWTLAAAAGLIGIGLLFFFFSKLQVTAPLYVGITVGLIGLLLHGLAINLWWLSPAAGVGLVALIGAIIWHRYKLSQDKDAIAQELDLNDVVPVSPVAKAAVARVRSTKKVAKP